MGGGGDKVKNKNNNKINDLLGKIDNKKHNDIIEKLYKDNLVYFYRIAYAILRNKADAEDAVNDSFLKFYKYIHKFSDKKCPEIVPYFVSIVKTVSINMKKRQKKVLFSDFSEELINRVSYSEGADMILEKVMLEENVNSLLSALSDLERDILEFRVIDGLTFKEIAKRVGLSEEASKKRYQRMLKKIKEGVSDV